MYIYFLLKGLFVGLLIALPIGPVAVLCIRRTVAKGRLAGLFTGLGSAIGDVFYGSIFAFGLTSISSFLFTIQPGLKLAGGLFLMWFGLKIFCEEPKHSVKNVDYGNFGNFSSTFLGSISNPLLLIALFAIISLINVTSTKGNYAYAATFIAGLFIGSAIWWLLLVQTATFFRKKIDLATLRIFNRISGTVMMGIGIYCLTIICK